jgi:hypothetical protein
MPALNRGRRREPGPSINRRNPHGVIPALRVLFLALQEWVRKGAERAAVEAENVQMPAVPGFAHAPGDNRIVPAAGPECLHPKRVSPDDPRLVLRRRSRQHRAAPANPG